MIHRIFTSLSLSLLLVAGCGSNVGLSGKVVFSDDKSPLPSGTVGLLAVSGDFSARGDIQSNGTFVAGSVRAGDGIPPGKYRVTVSAIKVLEHNEETGEEVHEFLVDPKFGNAETSGLMIDITRTTRNFTIEVDRYVPATGRR